MVRYNYLVCKSKYDCVNATRRRLTCKNVDESTVGNVSRRVALISLGPVAARQQLTHLPRACLPTAQCPAPNCEIYRLHAGIDSYYVRLNLKT